MVNKFIQKSVSLLFVAGVTSFGVISCTAHRNFQMEVLEPASISVDVGKRVALYDRNVRNAESDIKIEDDSADYQLFREFANGLNNQRSAFANDTVVLLKNHQSTLLEDGVCPQCLASDTLAFLYQKYNIDYLLSLELISYKMWREEINCYWMLRLYQQGKSRPVDSVVINKSFLADTEMPDAMFDDLSATYWDGGYAYAHRVIPTWVKTERRVYKQGRVLALGNVYMEDLQTEKAAELWGKIAKMKNKKGVKANLNLACLYESTGDYLQAQLYLVKAQKLAQQVKVSHKLAEYIHKYIEILHDRIQKESILEKQINID